MPGLSASDPVAEEAAAHELDDVGRRWMKDLIAADATLPAPTAAAMVSAALRSPLGEALRRLDEALHDIGRAPLDGLTTSQRRVLLLLLSRLRNRIDGLLLALKP